jgi:hypothetical protein
MFATGVAHGKHRSETFSEEMNRNKTKQAKKLARVVAGAETIVEEGAAVRAGASAGGGLELL